MKQAINKATHPGRKQIYRQVAEGKFIKDRLALASEAPLENEQPLLQLVMKQGQRIQPPESLEEIQKRTAASVASLLDSTRQLNDPTPLPVEISETLQQLTEDTQRRQAIEASLKS
jgi:nicotinate phosphoribosyltransferase